jgi:hypothetical protein
MFAGYRDEVDKPTAADDGVFIPQKELYTWWKQLQKKHPTIYTADEVIDESFSYILIFIINSHLLSYKGLS